MTSKPDSSLPIILRHLKMAGLSARALARSASVDSSLLTRILHGERTATPAVRKAVAEALERLATECQAAARKLQTNKGKRRTL